MGKLPYLLIIISLLVVVSCTSQSNISPEPIRIGLVAPFTGSLEMLGDTAQKAAQLKVAQINEQGGLQIDGVWYEIELLVGDDAGLPENAIEATRRLIYNQNVVAIVGPMLSRTAIPATIITEEAQVPMLLPNATNPAATRGKSLVYRVAFVDSFQGVLMANFAYETLAARKTAVLFDAANQYNSGVAHIYQDAFTALGGDVVAFESYVTDATDFATQLAIIKAADPDVLFLPNYSHELLRQIPQIRAAGIEATLIGSDGWSGMLPENLPLLESGFYSSHYTHELTSDRAIAFQTSYQERYGELPPESAALTYDTFGLLLQAIQVAGGVTSEEIIRGLQQMTQYEGVTGTILYEEGAHDPQRSAVILRIVDGQVHHYLTVNPNDLVEE